MIISYDFFYLFIYFLVFFNYHYTNITHLYIISILFLVPLVHFTLISSFLRIFSLSHIPHTLKYTISSLFKYLWRENISLKKLYLYSAVFPLFRYLLFHLNTRWYKKTKLCRLVLDFQCWIHRLHLAIFHHHQHPQHHRRHPHQYIYLA